uniref:ZMYM2-like/QRICH1 C-terminal domain-containing protein n=1 Tax=Amphimedon queenslandica TaxID=400682 RepID=A0A1X7TXR8_AMPQE
MVSNDPRAINFLDEKNPEFAGLRGVRDCVLQELWNAGIGVTESHTEGISFEEEQLLWSKGILGFDSPSNKVIRHYADSSLGNKCYHYILSFYFQKIPQDNEGNAFYLRPCSVTPEDHSEPWFMCQPVGQNTLDSMVARMFETVGVKG